MILAHNYQRPEVQDVADYVGDSLGLSRQAAATDAETIVFCGVHFMAETAAILSPEKTVLLPDLGAGCSLAASIDAEQLREWKAQHPGAVVVSYVNTTAEVKAESDYCCTSGNAKSVIEAIPPEQEILFLPDMYLGLWLEKVTGRKLDDLARRVPRPRRASAPPTSSAGRRRRPTPSCSSIPSAAARARRWRSANERTQILSTEKMIDYAKRSPKQRFLVATETGIIHRLQQEAPGKRFEAVRDDAECRYMKVTTLEKVRDSLRDGKHRITVEPELAERARLAIERMVSITYATAARTACRRRPERPCGR